MTDKNKETIKTYDLGAKFYSDKFMRVGSRESDIDLAFSFVNVSNPNCLELGCGDGRDAEVILKKTNKYIGIDASMGFLDIARERLPNADLRLADFNDLSFDYDQFDIIFAFASLHHLNFDELSKIFENVTKWLKIGGIFFISMKRGVGEVGKVDEFGERYFYLYKPEDLICFSKEKFKLLHMNQHFTNGSEWFELVFQK
ncbi:class I SAM-dependent methyltransferase [Candidatus Nomurabacteria bacterium]|nr:class I SAM-dependent methyltransferase [Candidatus Nomurabacteria bacterium]